MTFKYLYSTLLLVGVATCLGCSNTGKSNSEAEATRPYKTGSLEFDSACDILTQSKIDTFMSLKKTPTITQLKGAGNALCNSTKIKNGVKTTDAQIGFARLEYVGSGVIKSMGEVTPLYNSIKFNVSLTSSTSNKDKSTLQKMFPKTEISEVFSRNLKIPTSGFIGDIAVYIFRLNDTEQTADYSYDFILEAKLKDATNSAIANKDEIAIASHITADEVTLLSGTAGERLKQTIISTNSYLKMLWKKSKTNSAKIQWMKLSMNHIAKSIQAGTSQEGDWIEAIKMAESLWTTPVQDTLQLSFEPWERLDALEFLSLVTPNSEAMRYKKSAYVLKNILNIHTQPYINEVIAITEGKYSEQQTNCMLTVGDHYPSKWEYSKEVCPQVTYEGAKVILTVDMFNWSNTKPFEGLTFSEILTLVTSNTVTPENFKLIVQIEELLRTQKYADKFFYPPMVGLPVKASIKLIQQGLTTENYNIFTQFYSWIAVQVSYTDAVDLSTKFILEKKYDSAAIEKIQAKFETLVKDHSPYIALLLAEDATK